MTPHETHTKKQDTFSDDDPTTPGRMSRIRRWMGRTLLRRNAAPSAPSASHEAKDHSPDTLRSLETDNFVKEATSLTNAVRFAEQRTLLLQYRPEKEHISSDSMELRESSREPIELTEGEAVGEFLTFLDNFEQHIDDIEENPEELQRLRAISSERGPLMGWKDDGMCQPQPDESLKEWLRRKAKSLRETSFMGASERNEAAEGTASYWKSFLEENSENVICLPQFSEYRTGKSDNYVLESIFSKFSPEERDRFKGRFKNSFNGLEADPENVKIILYDDSMMGGDQMYTRHFEAARNIPHKKSEYRKCFEINLFISDEKRIEEGSDYTYTNATIPVKSYFKAPLARDAADAPEGSRYASRITNGNSSVDINFGLTIHNMVTLMRQFNPDKTYTDSLDMPSLTNIVRPYRQLDPVLTKEMLAA